VSEEPLMPVRNAVIVGDDSDHVSAVVLLDDVKEYVDYARAAIDAAIRAQRKEASRGK